MKRISILFTCLILVSSLVNTNYIAEKDVVIFNSSFNLRQNNNKKIKLPASEFGDKEF